MAPGTSGWTNIRRGLRYQFRPFEVRDFSGGLNMRDAPSELAENESPGLMNVTLDERGGVVKRLGLNRLSNALSNAAAVSFYSPTLAVGIVQDGTAVKKTTDFVTFTTLSHTLSSSAAIDVCEFNGLIIIAHPADGLYSFTGSGTTMTALSGSPKATALASWQNRLWAIGNPDHPTWVYSSGTDQSDWNTAGTGGAATVAIVDHDSAPLTAIGSGQAIDVTAKPTLLVFKARSTHRINDSATGAYQTIDLHAGCSGPHALTANLGVIVAFSETGVWVHDGLSAPKLASDKLAPLFTSQQINFSKLSGVAAGLVGQRVVFSFPLGAAQATNNYTLEFHPALGWFTLHNFGLASMTPFYGTTSKLYGASPTSGKMFDVFSGWADDGANITAYYQSHWFIPNGDNDARIRRLRLFGRGSFQLFVRRNYELSDGIQNEVAITNDAFVWGVDTWGGNVWGPTGYEGFQDFQSLGVARAVSFMFRETSSLSATGPTLLGVGAAPQVGSFAVYGFQVNTVPLGLS